MVLLAMMGREWTHAGADAGCAIISRLEGEVNGKG
jgi:hypothetical protein